MMFKYEEYLYPRKFNKFMYTLKKYNILTPYLSSILRKTIFIYFCNNKFNVFAICNYYDMPQG